MKRHIHAALAAVFFCLFLTVLPGTSSAHGHERHLVRLYEATMLMDPDTQTPFAATDLNNVGEVSGTAPRGSSTSAEGLNFADDVVGSDVGPTGRRALLWKDDTVEMLGTLPGMTE